MIYALQVAVGIIINKHCQILIAQRKSDAYLPDFWEFPGGKIESGENSYQALCRELEEEIGIEVMAAEPLTQIEYDYGDKQVNLHIWYITQYEGEPSGLEGQCVQWVPLEDLSNLKFLAANIKLIAFLQERYLEKNIL